MLVTIRVAAALPTLREAARFRVIAAAADEASSEQGRIVHYSVQDDHLHLLAEAHDPRQLARLMRRFQIRVALGLNALLGRRGKVFPERYHHRPLCSPRQVRNALGYLLNNRRHHLYERTGQLLPPDWLDPFSTAILFDGWRTEIDFAASFADPQQAWPAESWLLRRGWRHHGPLDLDEVPGLRKRSSRTT